MIYIKIDTYQFISYPVRVIPKISECRNCVYRSLLFSSLSEQELSMISANKKEIFYKAGETILMEGEEIMNFMYLKTGLVKIFRKGANRRDHIISVAKPYEFIGLLSLFSNEKYIYTIAALEDSMVCLVPVNIIKEIIIKNGKFAYNLIEKMNKVSDSILKIRIDLNSKQLRGRIAYILIFFSRHIYQSDVFYLSVSRKEIAELIDMRIENVVRILSEFRRDNIIRIEGKKIGVLDMSRLEEIAKLG